MPFPASHPALERALAAQGYAEPTPVQAAVLAADAADRDLLVSAQTGSGKTVAFGLAAAPTLLGEAETFGQAAEPLALVIAPTRELAMQVNRELAWLYAEAKAAVINCVGGMDARREQRALNYGAHIVVGTPGRLRDHIERGHLDLSKLKVAVLDEADEMLDMGFREDLEFILDAAPPERRTLLFSATLARDIVELAKRYQNDALRIDTIARDEPHRDIEYRAVRVAPNEVEHAVPPATLVFANTRESVRSLHAKLRERGFAVVGLSGELSQRERADALQALRDGHARVCVATDVAARGLDLPDLGLVIHAELPINKATLLHRSGRTGRAGKKGVSALVVPYTRRRKAEQLLYAAGVEAEWGGAPSADSIREKDQERLLEDPIFSEVSTEEDIALAEAMLAKRTPVEIAAALIRTRRAKLPSPEDIYDDPRHGRRSGPPHARRAVGRRGNADPKWLIPMICRLGHITKKDIGSIRIFDYDTKFEISAEAATKFGAAVQSTVREDVSITPTTAPAPRGERPPRTYEPRDPNAPPREFKPRPPRGEGDERPQRPPFKKRFEDGDRPQRDFKPRAPREDRPYSPVEQEDRPKRAFKPRHDERPQDERPRDFKPRAPRTEGDAPKKPFKKRFEDNAAGPKPYAKPYAGKRDGDGPAKPFKGPKPFKPRGEKKPFKKK
ncbi:DEAD/DEAH box helicase [Aphelenchoides fujianensis]|nr:DEAD/DEAH box helicase [Aphelenchoides fujianensis]